MVVSTVVQATDTGSARVVEDKDGGGVEALVSYPEGAVSTVRSRYWANGFLVQGAAVASIEGRCDWRRILRLLLAAQESSFAHGAGITVDTRFVLLAGAPALLIPLLLASSPEEE